MLRYSSAPGHVPRTRKRSHVQVRVQAHVQVYYTAVARLKMPRIHARVQCTSTCASTCTSTCACIRTSILHYSSAHGYVTRLHVQIHVQEYYTTVARWHATRTRTRSHVQVCVPVHVQVRVQVHVYYTTVARLGMTRPAGLWPRP